MKRNKMIGKLSLMFAVCTVLGMVLDNDTYWSVYNYATLIFFLSSGIVLLKQK